MKLFLFACCSFIYSNLIAQSPKNIETDLLKAFKKIDYWDQQRSKDATMAWSDSLEKANDVFGKKLKDYTQKYPATITYPFNSLAKEHLNISSSADGLFRIYSWDTQTGGTMRFFRNVFQYKSGNRNNSRLDTPKSEGDIGAYYRKVYTFKNNAKTYYLCVFMFIESSKYYGEGIKVFLIDKDKFNDNLKLIKTNTSLDDGLNYEYHFGSIIDWKLRPEIYFDAASKTINLPLIAANGKVTHKYISYKFTGQYFERVKN